MRADQHSLSLNAALGGSPPGAVLRGQEIKPGEMSDLIDLFNQYL